MQVLSGGSFFAIDVVDDFCRSELAGRPKHLKADAEQRMLKNADPRGRMPCVSLSSRIGVSQREALEYPQKTSLRVLKISITLTPILIFSP